MERELRDELEVPGHVVMIENMTVKDALAELKALLAKYPDCKDTSQIPDPQDRARLLHLYKGLKSYLDVKEQGV